MYNSSVDYRRAAFAFEVIKITYLDFFKTKKPLIFSDLFTDISILPLLECFVSNEIEVRSQKKGFLHLLKEKNLWKKLFFNILTSNVSTI